MMRAVAITSGRRSRNVLIAGHTIMTNWVEQELAVAKKLEISGCRLICDYTEEAYYEAVPCESMEADIHSVYAVHPEGYATVLDDFDTYGEARAYAEHLSAERNLSIWERR